MDWSPEVSTTKTICPEPQVKRRLDHPAEASCRPTSDPAVETIRDCVDLSEWQTREIRIAVAEAERGDFASDDLVRDVLGNWGVDAGEVARDGAEISGQPKRAGSRWP